MKLESLKNDKFEAFKKNELQNAFQIVGGTQKDTTYKSGPDSGCDTINRDTHKGPWTSDGETVDYKHVECEDNGSLVG